MADLSTTIISFGFSDIPNELLDKPIIFTSLLRTQVLKALFVKQDRLQSEDLKIWEVLQHSKHTPPKVKQPIMELNI